MKFSDRLILQEHHWTPMSKWIVLQSYEKNLHVNVESYSAFILLLNEIIKHGLLHKFQKPE